MTPNALKQGKFGRSGAIFLFIFLPCMWGLGLYMWGLGLQKESLLRALLNSARWGRWSEITYLWLLEMAQAYTHTHTHPHTQTNVADIFWHQQLFFCQGGVAICLFLSVSVCFCLFLSCSVCFGLFRFVSVCFDLFRSVSVCFCLFLFVSVCFGLFRFVSLCLSLSLYHLSLSLSLSPHRWW